MTAVRPLTYFINPITGCWEITSHKIRPDGYVGTSRSGKHHLMHRIAFEDAKGPIPEGMCVLHKCDVRHCVNPEHFFLGSLADNNKDRARKGRSGSRDEWGERNPNAKLTNKQVNEIRKLHGNGITMYRLSKRYGVGQSQIKRIVTGQRWSHSMKHV